MMLELNKVYNMDCMEGLKMIDDNSIDLVITDPPYALDMSYGRNQKTICNDHSINLVVNFIKELYPRMKWNSVMYLFFDKEYYKVILNHCLSAGFKFVNLLIWNKIDFGMGSSFRNQYELIFVFEKGDGLFKYHNVSNVLSYKMKDYDGHPHKKPSELIKVLIEHSSNENDIVYDGFAGSGEHIITAMKLNRRFIGFEIDIAYYDDIIKRLSFHSKQQRLI
jgi:site-specific DNA-methyltransferase (adenine-specific)